jgi:hypothetical protein
MAQAVSRQPLTAGARVHVGFMVDKMALGQLCLRVLRFSPVSIILPWLSMLIYHFGDKRKAGWWPQFRDMVSPLQHEQQDSRNGSVIKVLTGLVFIQFGRLV